MAKMVTTGVQTSPAPRVYKDHDHRFGLVRGARRDVYRLLRVLFALRFLCIAAPRY
jgi:hypothetical protein